MNNGRPILYVEDEDTDVFLMRAAFKRAGLSNPLQIAMDGVEAVDYLAGNGVFADRVRYPVPGLVLLDLNLPRKSGLEVLEWIRRQPDYALLPVVIYSSSSQERDQVRARELRVSDYVTKKSDVNQIAAFAVAQIERWLENL